MNRLIERGCTKRAPRRGERRRQWPRIELAKMQFVAQSVADLLPKLQMSKLGIVPIQRDAAKLAKIPDVLLLLQDVRDASKKVRWIAWR